MVFRVESLWYLRLGAMILLDSSLLELLIFHG